MFLRLNSISALAVLQAQTETKRRNEMQAKWKAIESKGEKDEHTLLMECIDVFCRRHPDYLEGFRRVLQRFADEVGDRETDLAVWRLFTKRHAQIKAQSASPTTNPAWNSIQD